MDGQAQERVGDRHHSRQDDGGRGQPSVDLTPSEIESWVDDAKRGMENALRAKLEDVREQYERQLRDLQETYGEAMLDLRAGEKL